MELHGPARPGEWESDVIGVGLGVGGGNGVLGEWELGSVSWEWDWGVGGGNGVLGSGNWVPTPRDFRGLDATWAVPGGWDSGCLSQARPRRQDRGYR